MTIENASESEQAPTEQHYPYGTVVKVLRSSGEIEEGWICVGYSNEGRVKVMKPKTNELKFITEEDLDKYNKDPETFAPEETKNREESVRIVGNILMRIYDEGNVFNFDSYEKNKAAYDLSQLGLDRKDLDAKRKTGTKLNELAEMIVNGEIRKS